MHSSVVQEVGWTLHKSLSQTIASPVYTPCGSPALMVRNSLKPRPYTPRFYLAALEKNREVRLLQGCEIKSGRVRPGFEAR